MMKRTFCFLLCICLAIFLVGCNNTKNNDNKAKVDIEYYAKLGQMPECEYSLGADVNEVNDNLKKFFEENEESVYDYVEGNLSVLIDGGAFMYFYEKAKSDNGISLIVNHNTAYGFLTGTIDIEIKEALGNYEYAEVTDIENVLSFLPSFENVSAIKYSFGDNDVIFVFTNNALTATVLYSTQNWTI